MSMANTTDTRRPEAMHAVSLAFRQYAPRLHRYLVRRIRGSTEVSDLTQEVFERFLRTGHPEAVRNPQAYLFRIASHVVADALLEEEQSPLTYDSAAVDAAERTLQHATPDDAAEQLDFARQLQQGLRELPAMHAAVLLLAVRDGLSHKEVARRTGLSVSTVGLYACEARARMRTVLEKP